MDCITKQYTIKVTEGNAFGLLLQLKTRTFQSSVPIDEDIDATQLQNIVIKVGNTTWESTDYSVDESGVLISIPADLPVGTYPVILTATYYGIQIRAAYYECFSIMPWSYQSDAGNYIPGSPIAAEAAYLIVGIIDDAELEELKQEYREKIAAAEEAEAEAEAAKEAFDEKAENLDNLDNVALQGADATATNTALKSLLQVIQGLIGTATDEQTAATLFGKIAAVLYAVGNIDFSAIAKESTLNTVKALIGEATDAATAATLFGKLAAVLNAVGNIDFSTLAKQGTNSAATLSITQAAVVDGNDTAVSVAKDVRSELGSGSDTAAETGTLFAVVKWVKDKVKSIFNLIGSPASGQPATLFAAIAAGGGGGGSYPAIDAELAAGKADIVDAINDVGGSSTTSESLGDLANDILALPIPSNYIEYVDNITTPIDLPSIIANHGIGIKKILNSSATSVKQTAFYQNNTIEYIKMPNVTSVEQSAFYSMSVCKHIELPDLASTSTTLFTGTGAATLCEIIIPNAISIAYSQVFRGAKVYKIDLSSLTAINNNNQFLDVANLVDLITGRDFATSMSLGGAAYNPTNAYATNKSDLCFATDQEEYGQTFNTNFDKWKWCIINHFAANLPDRTGMTAYTITFGATVLGKFDSDMTTAFTSKNWTLA